MEISKRFCTRVLLFCSIGLEKDVIYRRQCVHFLSIFVKWDLLLKWQKWRWPCNHTFVIFSKNNYCAQRHNLLKLSRISCSSVICWRQCVKREILNAGTLCSQLIAFRASFIFIFILIFLINIKIKIKIKVLCAHNITIQSQPCDQDHWHVHQFREWQRP